MSKKKKWILMTIAIASIMLLFASCDSSPSHSETTTVIDSDASFSTAVTDLNYVDNFYELLGTLNGFAESSFSAENVGKEQEFTLLSIINLGKITLTSFTDSDNYSYTATFSPTSGTVPGVNVDYSITGSADVTYSTAGTFSLSASDCVIDVSASGSTMLKATLDKDCSVASDGSVTVENNVYSVSDANLYGTVSEIIAACKDYDGTELDGSEVTPWDENISVSIEKDASSTEEIVTFNGTITVGTEAPTTVTVTGTYADTTFTLTSAEYEGYSLSVEAIASFNNPTYISIL